MSVWYCIPSADPKLCADCFERWQDMGYKTAVVVDAEAEDPDFADMILRPPAYPGYGASINLICEQLKDVPFIVAGGDDIWPDPNISPEEIAIQCTQHFSGTFGVMQPTGDPWQNHCAENVCGSPWLGKDFRNSINRGNGPYWPEYRHYFDDNELKQVAIREQCLWMRRDLVHYHNHWARRGGSRPPYLLKAALGHGRSASLFELRKSQGFPGSEVVRA